MWWGTIPYPCGLFFGADSTDLVRVPELSEDGDHLGSGAFFDSLYFEEPHEAREAKDDLSFVGLDGGDL